MATNTSQLREMVREVLREVVPRPGAASPAAAGVETVRIGNDHELAAFVARLMEPAVQAQVKAGKLRFTLGGGAVPTVATSSPALLSGVVSEKTVDKHAAAGALMLAADAVLTPLARDRARKLGLKIERRR